MNENSNTDVVMQIQEMAVVRQKYIIRIDQPKLPLTATQGRFLRRAIELGISVGPLSPFGKGIIRYNFWSCHHPLEVSSINADRKYHTELLLS